MFLGLVKRIVTYHVEPLEVVSEENLEVIVMGKVQSCIYTVIICAGVRRVFYLEVFYKHKVLNDLYLLNFPVLAEESADCRLVDIEQAAHV